MKITTEGVELDTNEMIRFFEDHCELCSLVLRDKNGLVVGNVYALTDDDRMVLDVDIPSDAELYSDIFHNVRVLAEEGSVYNLTILD